MTNDAKCTSGHDGTVGKTSIRRRYLGEGFKTSHLPTIGVDFSQKYAFHKGGTVRLVIWDLAGQPTFENVRSHYYQGSSGLLLVYSVVDRDSFDNASKWLVEYGEITSNSNNRK